LIVARACRSTRADTLQRTGTLQWSGSLQRTKLPLLVPLIGRTLRVRRRHP
jgi:hypothetical protein